MRVALVSLYLGAIVAANLSVAEWGPRMAIYNAFLFIGLDLTSRDRLHDLWRGRLLRNMALLIAVGSGLSYLFGLWLGTGPFVGRIALASCAAFTVAATADALAYHLLHHRPWYERVNQSNLAGAAVDSVVFVALWPFGFNFALAFALFAAKVAGGVVWSFLLRKGLDVGSRPRRTDDTRAVPQPKSRSAELASSLVPRRSGLDVGSR